MRNYTRKGRFEASSEELMVDFVVKRLRGVSFCVLSSGCRVVLDERFRLGV